MKYLQRYISWFCMLLFFCSTLQASEWNSFIINYSKKLYGNGAQTWQIASYRDNWAFFANQRGMLQFDGTSWSTFMLHNASDVRSIHPSVTQKRIYVGGINEWGYYAPGKNGKLQYYCMSGQANSRARKIGNIWGIHENDNILYIQGDNDILKYLNNRYTLIRAYRKIDCSGMINGVLYIGTDKGVLILVGNSFFPLQGAQSLVGKRIRDILPYRNGALIVTAYDGLFFSDGRQTIPIITGAEAFMRKNEVFCAAIKGERIALGTIQNGILLIDIPTRQVKYYNENNGMQNNTVLSLAFDKWNNLWAGLDSGIDYICLNLNLTNLYSFPYSFGTGYTASVYGKYLYLGTNRGLYYVPYPVPFTETHSNIRLVTKGSGQVWNLCRVGSDLFCLHDRGVFLVKGTSLQRIGQIIGAWSCQQVVGHPDELYVGTYDGLFLLRKVRGNWQTVCKIANLYDSCRFFEQESARVIWLYNSSVTYRLLLDPTLTHIVSSKTYGKAQGFPTDKETYVNKVMGRIYFATSKGIYRYDALNDRMIPSPEMNSRLNGATSYLRLAQYGNRLIGLEPSEICISSLNGNKVKTGKMIVPIEMPSVELVRGAENIIPLSDSTLILPNDNGFALLKMSARRKSLNYSRLIHIRNVSLTYPTDSLIYTFNFLGRKVCPEIAYTNNSIRFEYGLTSFIYNETVCYQYRLNASDWSSPTRNTFKEYTNLSEGNYLFEVRAIYPDGSVAVDSFSFRVLPPWYRRIEAYVFYLLLLLGAAWYLYRWDDRRVKQKKQQIVAEKDKQLEALEQEYAKENERKEKHIVELEKEKLQYDLQHKSLEMADLMINFTRKNEMLSEIKTELQKVMHNLRGEEAKNMRQMLTTVGNKIDSNMQSDEVLKRIEEQFDLVHNNFIRKLTAKYPDLSFNERMMCAYLKMNLSSKEMAPLLNISVRGVETIRYRLRKKFGLLREDNLIDFLDSRI